MLKLDVPEKNFQNFNEVKDDDIRVWNRCAMAFNIGSKSMPLMREYLGKFSDKENEEIQAMFNRIRAVGYENTRRAVIRKNNNKPHLEEANA